jgi:hypothetical protein
MIYLSILIPTLVVREKQLNKLLYHLDNQVQTGGIKEKIEVITFKDNFENKIGFKRNKLIEAASGKFTCFVDDDDILNDRYCNLIVNAIEQNEDIQHIGFKLKFYMGGNERKPVYHSLRYKGWYQDANGYYRQTTHLNPILSTISKSVKFQELNNEEDLQWANDIIKTDLLQKEVFIDEFMYFYYMSRRKSLSGDKKQNIKNQNIDWQVKDIKELNLIRINK